VDKNEELQKWLNDDRYVRRIDLQKLWEMSKKRTNDLLQKENVKAIKSLYLPDTGQACFYSKEECERAYENSRAKKQKQDFDRNVELQKWLNNTEYIQTKELNILWRLSALSTYKHLHLNNIRPVKRISRCPEKGCCVFYDRAECERARPFIIQPEQKEVEQVEEKQMELPEPTEQTPDIIPADTIDLFTMSELETELKNRGVELTADVRAKINASDMPEMKHIATMLRGNAKSIAIRLSVLNEIAGQLREIRCGIKNESSDEIGKPRVIWLSLCERVVFEFLRDQSAYTAKDKIVEHIKKGFGYVYDSDAKQEAWTAISALRDMGCLDAKDGYFMINSNYASTKTMRGDIQSGRKTTDPSAIDIGLENGKPINYKIKESGWYTIGIISELSGKSESWLRSYLPAEDCLIAYGNHRLIKAWRPQKIIQWLTNRNIFVRGWGDMKKYPKNGMRKYNPDFDKIAFDMASQNKSDIEISKRLNVTIETFNKYKKEIPSFSNAINSGMAAYVTSITSPQSKTETTNDKGICINQDLRDKLRFMAMADNVDLVTKLESIITAAWLMGNYENK
jgi:hypothetical protein